HIDPGGDPKNPQFRVSSESCNSWIDAEEAIQAAQGLEAQIGSSYSWMREPVGIVAILGVITAIIGLFAALLTFLSAWLSPHRDDLPQQHQPDRSVFPKRDEPHQPRPPEPREEKRTEQKLTLDGILDVLERHHQRATYGAVAGIIGKEPASLFGGYARTP